MTARELYTTTVVGMPDDDRLELATLILQGLRRHPFSDPAYNDSWSEEDMEDILRCSMRDLEGEAPLP